jgi:hypothetical protein
MQSRSQQDLGTLIIAHKIYYVNLIALKHELFHLVHKMVSRISDPEQSLQNIQDRFSKGTSL